jgi:arylsulfatase A-like enzyme
MHPLKGYKGTYYEGGIRVPLVVKWSGVIEPGTKNDVPVTGVDIFPTFCEIAGATVPHDQALDGISLIPLLKGDQPENPRALYWHFPAYLQSYSRNDEQRDPLYRSRPCSIIRYGDWKLHEYFEDSGLELYNLREDIGEATNLADSMPEKTKELHEMLVAWRQATKAPVPTEPNPNYDAAAEAAALEELSQGQKGGQRRRKQRQLEN